MPHRAAGRLTVLLLPFGFVQSVSAKSLAFDSIPLVFEENRGQAPADVRYLARGASSSLLITRRGAVLHISRDGKSAAIRFTIDGAVPGRVEPQSPLAGKSNYFHGSDPTKWLTHVQQFGSVRLGGIRPGVDVVFYGKDSQIEYDLILAPGVNPTSISLRFEGQDSMSIDANGDVVLKTAGGEIRHRKPDAWQETGGHRKPVKVRYALASGGRVRLHGKGYDPHLPLTVDPVIVYTTWFPVAPTALGVDSAGNVYVSGAALTMFQPTPGAYNTARRNAVVAKLNPTGTQLIYATYIGGSGWDIPNSIFVDAVGNAYVAGITSSSDYPLTSGALKSASTTAAFVIKLNGAGNGLVYSATLGSFDSISNQVHLAVDAGGSAYLGGWTIEPFPVTAGAFSTALKGGREGFVAKLNPAGSALAWATYLGGSGRDFVSALAVDAAGNVYAAGATDSADFPVTGSSNSAGLLDGFVVKLDSTGSRLLFATYLGGASDDGVNAVQPDSTGGAYVAGWTQSDNFPTTPGVFSRVLSALQISDGFVAKYTPTGLLAYSTYLGPGSVSALAVEPGGTVIAAGNTSRADFPVTPGSLLTGMALSSGSSKGFITRLNAEAVSLLYSTLVGGNQSDSLMAFALGPDGAAYVAGTSSGLLTSPGTLQIVWPAGTFFRPFVSKIDLSSPVLCNTISLVPSSMSFPAAGGDGSFDVNVPDGCPWIATSYDSAFFTLSGPFSGIGKGRVTFSVSPTSPPRTRTLTVGSATFTANQASGPCTDPVVKPASLNFTATGGYQKVEVGMPFGCGWQVQSLSPWLTLIETTGFGNGSFNVTAQSSSFTARNGAIAVLGKMIPVSQAGGACALSLGAVQAAFPSSGGTGGIPFTVTGTSCAWNAVSLTPWIQISNSAGSGSGLASFIVAPNLIPLPRAGSIYFEGKLLTVSQAAGASGHAISYTISAFAGRGYLGDGNAASMVELILPSALAKDTAGNVYFIETGRVRKISTSGIVTTVAGGGWDTSDNIAAITAKLSNTSLGLAIDAAGSLYLSEPHRVRKVGADGRITTIAGSTAAGSSGDDRPAVAALLSGPSGLAFDQTGNLFIADSANHKIRKVDPAGNITTFAGAGTAGFSGDGGPATAAQLWYPKAVFVDLGGNVYINDSQNARIRKVDPRGIISTVAGGRGTDNTPVFDMPMQIELDQFGNLNIAEAGRHRIRRVTPDGSVTTIAGTGNWGFSPDGGPATQTNLYLPAGVLTLPTGEILVGDTYNNRIRKLVPTSTFCSYSVTPATIPIQGPNAGSINVTISASSGCAWSVLSNVPWLTASPASGSGAGTVAVTWPVNPYTAARSAFVSIAGQTLAVAQNPSAGGGLRFVPVTPCRVADTRLAAGVFGGPQMTASSTRSFPVPQSACNIPATALAYSLNFTVVPAEPLSYLTAWPAGQPQPYVSTLNSFGGDIVANAAIVPAGVAGAISVFVTGRTDVVIDINGYFAASGDLQFYPMSPCRVADTRMLAMPIIAGTRTFTVPQSSCNVPAAAQAYSLNITAVPDGPLYYLAAWPAGSPQPYVSTLNSYKGDIVANAAIVPAGNNGAISIYVTDPSDVVIDINGYFAPPGAAGALSFYAAAPCRVADTRLPDGPFGGPSIRAASSRDFAVPSSACNIPAQAKAYSLNVTAVPPGPLSYLTAWPAGQPQPYVSTLNSFKGNIVANAAIVPAGAAGAISVFVTSNSDVILDINGFFAP